MDNYNIRFGEEIGEQAGLTMFDLLGTLTIETIQNIEKDTDKQYAKAMLYGFVRAIQAAFERI